MYSKRDFSEIGEKTDVSTSTHWRMPR